ncbi:MAG: TonB-dependent receptor [Bacteroidetes bacterium]|nr:TonB-dependent receptor [Bacteroidota bacterium]
MTGKLILSILGLLVGTHLFAQQGITGTVVDENGKMIGATVYITGDNSKITVTDVEAKYQINTEPGTYKLSVSWLGQVKDFPFEIVVTAGKFTQQDLNMGESAVDLTGAIVTGKAITNTDAAVVNEIQEGLTAKTGIGGTEISSSGASTAGDAIKQLPATSVEEGKYMVVRGLGDRYSISQVNGVTLPSTDPYRNSASLDLIPSFMLDNIVTEKTFSPNQPGNFTGGNMDIRTKSFPEKLFVNIGFSAAYNTTSSLKKGFIVAPEGMNDLPEELKNDSMRGILDASVLKLKSLARRGSPDSALFVDKYARELNTPFLPTEMNGVSPLDHGINFSMGNQHKSDESKNIFGYVIGLKYKKSYTYYRPFGADFDNPYTNKLTHSDIRNADAVYKRYLATKDNMQERFLFDDEKGNINENAGAFASLSWQHNLNHEYTFSTIYNSDVDNFARIQNGVSEQVVETNLYQARAAGTKERKMLNTQLRGKHVWLSEDKRQTKFEWIGGITKTSQFEPDLRFFSSHTLFYFDDVENNENARIDISSYGLPNHFFRELNDMKYDAKVDLTIPFTRQKANKIMVGGMYSAKTRDFSEYRFKVKTAPAVQENDGSQNWAPEWNSYLNNFGFDFTYEGDNISGFNQNNYYENDTRQSNFYTGTENIGAAYAMAVVQPAYRLKIVGGGRFESTDIKVTSRDTSLEVGSVNRLDFLPSLNLIYDLDADGKVNGEHKLRISGSRTLARPNMRELAPFFSFDFLGGFIYTGNENLDRTLVWNYDLTYQFFPENRPGEIFSVSAYYKEFINPIVKVFNVTSTTGEITFENLPKATVYGFELEYRKRLDAVAESLKNFTFATNLSYIYSQVAISNEEKAARDSLGMSVEEFRPFQGQSPYLANANIFYRNDSAGLNGALTFNVFGPRLFEVGALGNPDIYELPRPTLNLNFTKTFNDKLQLKFGVNNILDAKFRTQQEYKGEKYINEMYPLGRTFTFGVNYQVR